MEKDVKKDVKDIKKKPVPGATQKKRASFPEYIRGVRTEIRKVVWPTRRELGAFTGVVILACTFFSVFFGAIDFAVIQGLQIVLGISM